MRFETDWYAARAETWIDGTGRPRLAVEFRGWMLLAFRLGELGRWVGGRIKRALRSRG